MNREEAEVALLEAQQREASLGEQLQLRAQLDQAVREEEIKKQAVFFDISEEEARRRIEQNADERARDLPRTIWDEPERGGQ